MCIRDRLKIAILIGMMPKEYQDMVFQNGSAMTEDAMKNYQKVRDYIVNVATQRLQMARPTPMHIGGVDRNGGSGGYIGGVAGTYYPLSPPYQAPNEYGGYDEEDPNINALAAGRQCYSCGKFGQGLPAERERKRKGGKWRKRRTVFWRKRRSRRRERRKSRTE